MQKNTTKESDTMETAIVKRKTQGVLTKYLSGSSMDYRQIISLFIPLLIDQAFIVGLNILNTSMISSSGVEAVSAVNMVDSINLFLLSVIIAVATGGTVVVAQYKGSRNDIMVSKSAAGTVSSVALLSFAIGLFIIVLHNPLLSLLFGQADPLVFENARIYLIGSGISYVGIGIVEAVCSALRGIGKMRASLVLSLIMNLVYVGLNMLFIHGLHMGVYGMTISVNLARYLAAGCAIYYLIRVDHSLHLRLKELIHVNLTMLKKIMFIGLPFAAEQMFFNGGKILTQIFIVSLGTNAIATNAIAASLSMLFQIPSNALMLTLITVVGQCVGQKNIEDARKFIKSFLWLSSGLLLLMGLLCMPFFNTLISFFQPPQEIVSDIFWILMITLIGQISLWSISFMTPAALRAAGDAKYTSMVSMLSMWLFRVVLGYILGITLGYGIMGVWVAMNLEWGVRGFLFLRRYKGELWYQHKLID